MTLATPTGGSDGVGEGVARASVGGVGVRTYGFLVFLALLNALNILDRNLVPTFANDIKADLHLSNGQFGLLSGIMFTLLYGLISPIMGLVADTTHRPRLAGFGVGLWSLLTAATGLARGFVSLALPRLFIGVGESALTPPALSLLADRFPARQMGFVSGFYYAGAPVGVGLAYLIAGALGPAIGWRNCFILIGAIGVLMALVLGVQPETRARPARGPRSLARSVSGMLSLIPEFFRATKRSPALLLVIAGGVACHFVNGATQFETLWWKEELHLATGPLFLKVALISATAGVAGSVISGLIADWWLKATGQGRPIMLALMLLILTPIGVFYRLTDHAGVAFWIGICGRLFQLGVIFGASFSTLQELVPARIRATTFAVFILSINVFGLGASSTLGGYLIDALAKAGDPRPIGHVLAILTLASGLAIPCYYLAGRRLARDREALAEFEARPATAIPSAPQ